MAQEILLPVKVLIENLQSIAKDMRSQLGTLKIDSSGYKRLESVIVDIEKRIQQLQVISSRPFIDTKQFTNVSKEIVGILDDITKIGIEARKVKFSDLSLDASLKAKLLDFDKQIKSINDLLKLVKESAKSTFLDTDAGKAWKIAHPKDAAQSFTLITKAIETEINKLESALKKAEAANKEYQDRLAARRELNKFIQKGHGLTKDNLGEKLYNQIFSTSGNFKTGGKTVLLTWLEELFKLDPSVALNLTKEAGNKVRAAFSEASGTVDKTLRQERNRMNTSLKEEKARTNDGASYVAAITAAQTSLTAENAAKEAINQTNLKLSKTEEELANSLRKAKLDREQYTIALTLAATGQLQMGSACSAALVQLLALSATVDLGKAKLASLDLATGKLLGISNFVNRYVGAYAIIRKVSTAIRNAFNNIKELDKVITSIAVVTNMSLEDLWNKVGQYTQMAQEYGVATKDVYTVSLIFYQQGLLTSLVMDLTTETLKMAKIAGMEYSAAANAMTVAVRAFKIEMTDAQQVTDTYSALAAKFAVSSAEIANAMEKTASSAASVGMSLESTSAFISVMEQTTRESAQNIGSALKSIISRYGEMKASPDKLINVDGEEVAFNKVDTALSSIGISIKDAAGQFRDFDDVIMELASKWDALDNNTQRYIATVMAGNRQQSRFIALVSNYDELKRAMATANDAENASIVQVAKTMDSLESKANLLKNAFSLIYLDLHVESGLKDVYDWLTRILKTMGKLGTLKGVLPTLANIVGLGTGTKSLLKSGMNLLQELKGKYLIETQEAEDKIKSIREEASKDIVAKYKVLADLSELLASKLAMELQLTLAKIEKGTAADNAFLAYRNAGGTADRNTFDQRALSNPANAKAFLLATGVKPEDLNKVLGSLDAYQNASNAVLSLALSITDLDNTIKGLTGSKELEKASTDNLTQSLLQAATSAQETANADLTKTSSAVEAAQANYDAALAARDDALAKVEDARNTHVHGSAAIEAARKALFKAEADRVAALKALEKALADERGALSDLREAEMSDYAADADKREGDANNRRNGGGGWNDHATAMKVTGLMTSVARLAGTAITALGAAHQDKSTDTVEMSKIYTGLGNGLSMAGTGASMGMVFGPWGAALGAIGGFLVGGLGALLDGALMTLEEKLALLKLEAKEASDEALKKLAAATDLNSLILNLETLRKAMYNSNEDMLKYTDAMNTMAGQYPELVSSYDAAGNAIIDLNAAEALLAETRASASAEASKAARLEARARATTIETLESAYSEVVSGQKRVYETYTDKSGKLHAFFSNGQWSDVLNDLRSLFSDEVDSWNLNQIITGLNEYLGNGKYNYVKSWRNIFNEKATVGQDGAITLADDLEAEMSLLAELHNANTTLKNRATDLNITAAEDVDSELAYVYGFMGWDSSIKITAERIKEFDTRLSERIEGYEKTVDILDASLPILDSLEALDYALLSKDTKKASKISTSKVAAKLIANQLEAAAKQFNYDTAADWSKSEDADALSAYTGAKTTATNIVVDWLTGLTETELDNFLTIFGETNKYFSVEDMFNNLGYKSTEDFTKDLLTNYGLDPQQSENLLISLQKSFADSVQSDRDRILKTVYAYDENGNRTWKFNDTGLAGISKINGADQAQSIAYRFLEFDGASEIISQYADYFTSQLVAINKLAEDGYTELALTRLNSLYELSTILTDIDDSKVLRDLFTTISTIDFSNYDSLVKAQKSIESYLALNGKTAETDAIIAELINALENLIFNLNTLALGVTEKVTAAAKEIDGILSTNSSGMDLSKAIAALNELNTGKTGKEALSFNEALRFDTELGKYIYTVQGLDAAIAALEAELNKEVTKLLHTQELYKKGVSFTENAPTTFTEAQDIIDNIQDYETMDADSKALYLKLAKDFITATSDVNDLTLEKFVEYVSKQVEAGEIEAEKALALVKAYEENKPNIIYSNIDWSKIASNTDYGGENREFMDQLIGYYSMSAHATYQEVIKRHLDSIYGEGESPAKAAAQEAIFTPIIDAEIKQYQDAISELLDPSARISVATEEAASKLDIGIDNVRDSVENAITAALDFLNLLATQIGQGSYTIESYNNDAKSILDKTLGRLTQSKAAMDFISSDITGDSLLTLANTLNLKLTDIVDVATGQVKGIIGDHLKFNVLTGKYDITSSFDEFIDAMNEQFNIYIMKGTKQYTEALKAFNDTEINEYDRINKNVSEEINKVLSAKGGLKLNLAQTFTSLSDKALAALVEVFNANGADFTEGILTIKEGANIAAIAEALALKAAEEGLILLSEFDSLVDAINDLLSSITSSITSGITGKLSASKARDLLTWAKNNGLGELDFTRTKDGLKLSLESAQELYDKLKDIDSISAQIVLDELNKSIEESVTSAKELKGTMKEVAELRSTTESDDFKFMDNKIPSGLNNPINYLNNWSEAFKKMNEAGKAGGKMKNKMDYSDFYNIITEMGNLALLTGEVKLSGEKVLHNSKDAAALIEEGALALSIAADGSIKVDLSKLGIDFSTGAKDLKANVGKGIQEVAQSQVEMLDSMIQLLETIVAMEKLGDIDVEGNGIDFEEMFTKAFPDADGNWSYAWTLGMQNAAKNILEYADSLGEDSDLYKGLENVKVNGTSMRKIFEEARDNVNLLSEKDALAYHAAVKAFYAAMQSGDYDLDNIMSSIKEVLAGTGFEGEIEVGDMTLTFHYGLVITKTETGKYVGGNGKEYASIDEAAWSLMLALAGIKANSDGSYTPAGRDQEGKITGLTGKLIVGESSEPIKVIASGDHLQYQGADKAYDSLDRALESFFIQENSDQSGQWTDRGQEGFSEAFKEWKILKKYTVVPTLDKIEDIKLDSTLKNNLIGKTVDDLNKEWNAATTNEAKLKFKANYGIDLGDNGITEEEFNKIKELNGLESKIIETTVNATVGEGEEIMDVLTDKDLLISAVVNVTATGDTAVLDALTDRNKNASSTNGPFSFINPKFGKLLPNISTPIKLSAASTFTPNNKEAELRNEIEKIRLEKENAPTAPEFLTKLSYSKRSESRLNPNFTTENAELLEYEKPEFVRAEIAPQAREALIRYEADETSIDRHEFESKAKEYELRYSQESTPELSEKLIEAKEFTLTPSAESEYELNLYYDLIEGITSTDHEITFHPVNKDKYTNNGEVFDPWGKPPEDVEVDVDTDEADKKIKELWDNVEAITSEDNVVTFHYAEPESNGRPETSNPFYVPSNLVYQPPVQIDTTLIDEALEKLDNLNNTVIEPEVNIWELSDIPEVEEEVSILDLTDEPIKKIEDNLKDLHETTTEPEVSITDLTDLPIKKIDSSLTELDNSNTLVDVNPASSVAATMLALESVRSSLAAISALKNLTINITKNVTTTETTAPATDTKLPPKATGTVGLAKAQGTLMGELGPELIVSNGRYFVAGLNGPEFVNLASDAIVFNHLLTEQLLKHGMSSTRGQAVTNERNAVAFASGNINGGPAMASARAALAALKQLRAQWLAIAGMSAQDFAGLGGSGGGGGGGNKNDPKKFVKELEIWYNWLLKIAELEEKINYLESLRSKYAKSFGRDGASYAKSNLETLNLLREQAVVHLALVDAQEEYYKKRQKEINENNGPFSELYGINDYGQLYYKNAGFLNLSLLSGRDSLTGEGNLTAADQYATLVSMGFEKYMEFDSSGNKIDKTLDDWYVSAVLAFWDKIDSDKEEMQSLHDSIEEHKKAVVENLTKAYEILHEIEDNLMSVEDKVIKAIESTRQREIDELLKQRDAIEKSALKLIDGLSEQLNREKDLYSQLETEDELASLQRRAAILRSSGGSLAEIASVEDEISLKLKDMYFDALQRQIDSLLEAKDAQLERLDAQLALMTETLEYEKENGLLWGLVYEVMALSAEEIADFIVRYDSDYWGKSATRSIDDYRDALYEADLFKTYLAEMKGGFDSMVAAFSDYSIKLAATLEKAIADMKAYTDANIAAVKNDMAAAAAAAAAGGNGNPSGSKSSNNDSNQSGESLARKNARAQLAAIENALNVASRNGQTDTARALQAQAITLRKLWGFKEGGMVDFTGLTIVHGSSNKPESVLNAKLTEILRNDILGNSPNSLMNLLLDFKNAYSGISNGTSSITNNSSGITIEQAIVEMHVSKMSNDYDAQRAGEQALEKMVQIARKSQGQNRVGR